MGAETSKISIGNCLISVFKSDKLGFDGGAFCANGADLTMTNATFFGRTDSDNVAVLSADTIAMTGCTLRVEAEKSVHALLGSVSIADCSLYASGHSGNSAKTVSQTAGLDAFETVSQQSGVDAAGCFRLCRCQDRSCLPAGCFVLHGRRTDDRNWESGVLSGQAHDPRHARHRSLAHGRKSCRAGKWRLYRPESRLVPAGRRLGRTERHCCRNRRGHVLARILLSQRSRLPHCWFDSPGCVAFPSRLTQRPSMSQNAAHGRRPMCRPRMLPRFSTVSLPVWPHRRKLQRARNLRECFACSPICFKKHNAF